MGPDRTPTLSRRRPPSISGGRSRRWRPTATWPANPAAPSARGAWPRSMGSPISTAGGPTGASTSRNRSRRRADRPNLVTTSLPHTFTRDHHQSGAGYTEVDAGRFTEPAFLAQLTCRSAPIGDGLHLALGQREAQGLVGQRLPLKGRHLGHDLRAVGLLNHYLYCELHAFTSSSHTCSGSSRSRRLMARRSQRLTL